jgi:hypothetical protein
MYDLGKVRPRRGYSYKKDDRTGKKKKKSSFADRVVSRLAASMGWASR